MQTKRRKPNHPGAILYGLYMEPLNLTITGLAEWLGVSRKTISKIVNGRGGVTPDMALRLSKALKTTPELWLNLQNKYDLYVAKQEGRDWKEVKPLATDTLAA